MALFKAGKKGSFNIFYDQPIFYHHVHTDGGARQNGTDDLSKIFNRI